MAWVLDLDGVLWRGNIPIPGSAEAIERLRAAGERVGFVTNNSAYRVGDVLAKLERIGVPTPPDDLITSAQAAARLLQPGSTALVCGGEGIIEALESRGVKAVREGPADAVIVGFHRDFNYDRLAAAFASVRGGARLIGTNDDATLPTDDGELPGGGSILAAVAYATGIEPQVAGKPFTAAAALVTERLGTVEVMVGDRPSTDGRFARMLNAKYALVLSGVTSTVNGAVVRPDLLGDDLASVVDQALGGRRQ